MTDKEADELSADDLAQSQEFRERALAHSPELQEDVQILREAVLAGIKSVRGGEVDEDTLQAIAQQAFIEGRGAVFTARRLGRAWGLANRPAYAERDLRARRNAERREQRDARAAKENWERGDASANEELFPEAG